MKKVEPQDKNIENLLSMRQYAIGLALSTERMLETLGHPVESAIITRRKRRHLTSRDKNNNM